MTEQNGFGGLAVAEPQTPVLPVHGVDSDGPDNRRKLALVGAVAAALVVILAAFFLLKGGGDDAAATLPPHVVPPATDQSADGGTATASADKPVTLPKPYKDPVGRDPFKPLYVAPAVVDNGTAPAPKDSGVVTVTAPQGPAAPTATTPTGDGTTASAAPVWIELVSVKGTKTASFVVGYSDGHKSTTTAYGNVAVPTDGLRTTFAGVFALLSIQDKTVTVQFGDGTPFDLTPGFGNRHFVG